jgi:hypothetical protein
MRYHWGLAVGHVYAHHPRSSGSNTAVSQYEASRNHPITVPQPTSDGEDRPLAEVTSSSVSHQPRAVSTLPPIDNSGNAHATPVTLGHIPIACPLGGSRVTGEQGEQSRSESDLELDEEQDDNAAGFMDNEGGDYYDTGEGVPDHEVEYDEQDDLAACLYD